MTVCAHGCFLSQRNPQLARFQSNPHVFLFAPPFPQKFFTPYLISTYEYLESSIKDLFLIIRAPPSLFGWGLPSTGLAPRRALGTPSNIDRTRRVCCVEASAKIRRLPNGLFQNSINPTATRYEIPSKFVPLCDPEPARCSLCHRCQSEDGCPLWLKIRVHQRNQRLKNAESAIMSQKRRFAGNLRRKSEGFRGKSGENGGKTGEIGGKRRKFYEPRPTNHESRTTIHE